jgi:hypothetical protein
MTADIEQTPCFPRRWPVQSAGLCDLNTNDLHLYPEITDCATISAMNKGA